MVRFISVVSAIDKITDCLPVVSSLKNAGILLYQQVHKVNSVANPVNPSWKDDIKIHALSKDHFISSMSAIPIFGNFFALFYHAIHAIAKARGGFIIGGPRGYLCEATRAFSWGMRKHGPEVVALYLARNKDRPEQSLKKALTTAAYLGNKEVFKLILDSRTWSSRSIQHALCYAKNTEIAVLILEKYQSILNSGQVELILNTFSDDKEKYSLVELLIATYPNIDLRSGIEQTAGSKDGFKTLDLLLKSIQITGEHVARALEKAAEKGLNENVALLLERVPGITSAHIAPALIKASENELKDTMELLLKKAPDLASTHLDCLLENAAKKGNINILNWLTHTYKEFTTTASIGKILEGATRGIYFKDDNCLLIIQNLVYKYPDLPAKDLKQVLDKAATHNAGLFKLYLDVFTQLRPEDLQDILNDAVFIHGKTDDNVPTPYSERWQKVAELIKQKFPDMIAVDPYA